MQPAIRTSGVVPFSLSFILFAASAAMAQGTPAGDPGPESPPRLQDPEPKGPAGKASDEGSASQDGAPEAPSGARLFGVVNGDAVAVRCFPTDQSSVFEDVLTDGSPVQLGDTYGSYRQVFLPAGIIGYVHSDYTTDLVLEGEGAGTVSTTVDRVSWRYRPMANGEPPVARLPKDAVLTVLDQKGDWWRVRQEDQVGWVPAAEVTVVEPATPTVLKAWDALGAAHRQASVDLVAGRLAEIAEREADAERNARFAEIRAAFDAEMSKRDNDARDFQPIEASLESFKAEVPEGSPLLARAVELEGQVSQQVWLQEAMDTVEEQPVPVPAPVEAEPAGDPLASFDAVGWLKHHPRNARGRQYSVQKGGQILFWVHCSSGRYDLDMFVDAELGIRGSDHRPEAESLRILDAQRIQVLSAPPR